MEAQAHRLAIIKRVFSIAWIVALRAHAADPEESCRALLDRALPVWTVASVSQEVEAFAEEQQADPVRIRGDFDGDGRQDIALLIQNKARPVLDEPERINATRVAVCLAKEPSVVRLIEAPYCDDLIYLVRKGKDMDDIEAGHRGTYPVDAIGTTCFEKAGAVFFLDGNDFRRIINSD